MTGQPLPDFRETLREAIVKEAWTEAWHGKPCAVGCGRRAVHGHHVITTQALRRYGFTDRLWDPRNCLPVCFDCHGSHHGASRRIPLSVLSEDARAFADELGLGYLLERYYS